MRDIPGFFITRRGKGWSCIDRVGSDNLWLQYDIYHMQIMEGDLARTIEANLGRIAHIQIADNPGRNEPGTGEINYPYLYDHIDRIGYAGWVGAEYKPKAGTEGLGWFTRFAGKGSAAALRAAGRGVLRAPLVLPDISPTVGRLADSRVSPIARCKTATTSRLSNLPPVGEMSGRTRGAA